MLGYVALDDGSLDDRVREETGGYGADIYVDALGPGAPHETFLAGMRVMARGGIAVHCSISLGCPAHPPCRAGHP
ncbi:hypothetical protein [Streptomyces tibetensis]|uniref:hypothetical protein n=1 Tax=Streptomyces tibetensis TaxID=2382123 RepID=UPI003F53F826